MVVCREFDWENDHRLRRLLAKDDTISVTDFSLDEVKSSLRADGFNTALFDAKQLELLRLPQNLSLFLDANYSLISFRKRICLIFTGTRNARQSIGVLLSPQIIGPT